MSLMLILRCALVGLIIGVCWALDVYFHMGPLAWIFALVWSGLALFWQPTAHITWDTKDDFGAAIDDPEAIRRIDEVNDENRFLESQNDRDLKKPVRKPFGRH